MTRSGTLSTLYSFCSQTNCADGSEPLGGVVLGTDGNFYGTTFAGGDVNCDYPSGCGTVFRITPAGTLTTLYTFHADGSAGDGPEAGLVQGTDGGFYGTTGLEGGAGTIFRITASGIFNTLHVFSTIDGAAPYGGLIQATDGNFYGTTYLGGTGTNVNCGTGCGTVFKMTPSGNLTTLHSFDFADGAFPVGGLVQAGDGNFYGTTGWGGANQDVCVLTYPFSQCGTVFRITPAGELTTLYNFCSQTNCTDGLGPYGTLVQATDGDLYGTTTLGGEVDAGTIFKITTRGGLTTLHSFDQTDGLYPYAGPVQATNGTFYGTTAFGGTNGNCPYECGTVFGLSVGLGPFVTFVQRAGRVGQPAEILGQGFTGATNVSFNGTPASYSVKRDTYITATVPVGATTGPVSVTTPKGTLTSNVNFRVVP